VSNNLVISDLKLTLQAIEASRLAYEQLLAARLIEARSAHPNLSPKELYSKVSMSSELRDAFQNLMSLYGCIGSSSSEYVKVLSKVA
jgi:hypothetical protein